LDQTRRTAFDQIAELYDQVRPGYPEALVDDVIALSKVPPFARRGYTMVCLELGERLAALAAAACRPYPRVQVVHTAFEDWPLEESAFDLVISAQAFHWIPPDVGYARAAATLRDTGALALFWNHQRVADPALLEAIEAVYRERAPLMAAGPRPRPVDELEASGHFGPVAVRRHPWTARHGTELYVKGVSTASMVRALDKATRERLLSGIGEAVEAHGGQVELRCVATLYVASVLPGARPQKGNP
jgi:SAM-dependent methyltransferase